MAGDLRVKIKDKEYKIESKRKQNSNGIYNLAEVGLVHISGFCYLLRQDLMKMYLHGIIDFESETTIPDKGFKTIHNFFDQDDADIVTIVRPWHNYLFLVRENIFKEIKGEIFT